MQRGIFICMITDSVRWNSMDRQQILTDAQEVDLYAGRKKEA